MSVLKLHFIAVIAGIQSQPVLLPRGVLTGAMLNHNLNQMVLNECKMEIIDG